jgi:DNA-binding SARP family transcriptional activator
VIWITGPAGSGKTTLVSSYIDANKLPCLWYQVDEGDSDIASFFYYMGLAAKKAVPGRRKPMPLLTPEYLLGIPTFTLRFFENLCGRLNPPSSPFKKGVIKKGFVLVFDNCHRVAAESPFHEAILTGITAIPDGLNVILISRNEPPSAYAQLQANRQMSLIGWNKLRLTLQESRTIMGFCSPEIRSKEMIERLYRITDGWVAGLILISEGVRRGVGLQSLEKSAPEDIVDYFGSELFSKVKKKLQIFLMKTAFMPRMTAKMANRLTGFPDSGNLLSTLTKNNYFIERRLHGEPVYQYHPLFRTFLIFRAKESFSTEMISDLLHRAALLLEDSAQFEEAVSLFSEEKNWEGLTGLILRQAPNLIAQGRSRTLEAWLNHYPKERIESMPWLLYWKGVCRLPYSPAEARLSFEQAFHLFEFQRDEPGTYLAWSGVVESIYYEYDDFTRLDQWINWLLKKKEHDPSFPSLEIEARIATNMAWALAWARLDCINVEKWLERAFELCQKIMDINLLFQNCISAMTYHLLIGETAKLSITLEETRRVAQLPSTTPLNLIWWKLLEAVYLESYAEDSHLQIQTVLEGLKIAQENGVHIMDHLLFANGVYGELILGDITKAEEFLQMMKAVLKPQQRNIVAHYHFLSGWCQLLRGQISLADFHAEKTVELAVETGTPIPEILGRLLMSRGLHKKGQYEEALAQLLNVKGLVEKFGCRIFEYYLPLTEAQFAMDRGEEERCVEALRQGLAFGNKMGLKSMQFIWQPSEMACLCAIALEKRIEVDYVRDLIRIFHLPPSNISLGPESWPWPLKIYTLGSFGLLKDDEPLQFSGKIQKKPLLLLKALVALGGKNVREERLSDLLWPEADGDQAYNAFRTTLSRLRQLIGNEKAIDYHEGKATIDPRYCWVDAWAFERIFEQIEAEYRRNGEGETRGRGEDIKVFRLIEKAISLYKGHFLADETDEFWTTSYRERLRNKYLHLITILGDYLKNSEQWEKAVECYQRALEVDQLAEEFYQNLMICYKQLGQNAKAIEVYKRCRKMLTSVLGIEPSPKTEAIHKTLVGNPRVNP